MFAEVFKGTNAECQQYVAGWVRPTRKVGVPDWLIKRDGITTTEDGSPRYLVLTDRPTGG